MKVKINNVYYYSWSFIIFGSKFRSDKSTRDIIHVTTSLLFFRFAQFYDTTYIHTTSVQLFERSLAICFYVQLERKVHETARIY